MYLLLLLSCLLKLGWAATTLARTEKMNGDAGAVSAGGAIEMLHSTAGMRAMKTGNLMNLAVVLGIDDPIVKTALVSAISNRIDAMRNSEFVATARTLGVGHDKIDFTADADDQRAPLSAHYKSRHKGN